MRILQLCVLIICALFSGCAIVNPQADHANLGETTWTLMAIGSTPANLGEAAILKFDEEEEEISGIAACNSFTAGYEMIRNAIKFEDLVTTKKYCEGKMDEENQIITALRSVTRYEVKANMLYFYDKGQLVLTYKR